MSMLISGARPIEVLLVEDSVEEAEMTMEALRDGRVRNRIHWVEDGEEALSFLRRQGRHSAAPRPDLVLLDLRLPRMSGHEVLTEIKQHADWRRIPVVIMTSSDDEKDILNAYDHHANCYVTKPVDMEKFLEVIRSIEDFWLAIVQLPAA
jgi:two-component system, chemotaxis family, response regulator Rcp1